VSSSLFAERGIGLLAPPAGAFRSSFLRSPAGAYRRSQREFLCSRGARRQDGGQRVVTAAAVICHKSPPQLSSKPVCFPL
jgi:hypothetical protein